MTTTTNAPLAERMYAGGFTDLIPVIPPGAALAPKSKISPSSIGKIPGFRLDNGLWRGFNWRAMSASLDDVKEWAAWGANIGLRADRFPAVDIDCTDERVAQIIEDSAIRHLGPAPVRVGNPPKRLLPYRTSEPFGRMRLWMQREDKTYLVEILGAGQQYLVAGTHPTTLRHYQWNTEPGDAKALTEITKQKAHDFLAAVQHTVEMLGFECKRAEGTVSSTRRGDQSSLLAPSIEELRQAVALIPNSADQFPGWDEYVKMLHAIRAAAGPDEEEGHDIFSEWADRWELHGQRHADSNDPDERRALWRRTKGPFSVGWGWIAEMARQYGFNDAPFPVEGEAPKPTDDETPGPPFLSDQWLAEQVVEKSIGVLRYAPASDTWYVWNRGYWQPDAEMLAEDTVKMALRRIADWVSRRGATEDEKKRNYGEARAICSAGKVTAIAGLVKSDRAIAVSTEVLDFDPWVLNTPSGIVALKTGEMMPPDPDMLCTRVTAVAPDFNAQHPVWDRFLEETTAGDADLQSYLKRLCGYALTGSTREHQYTFIYGPGGNGKGTFLNVLMGVLGTYHKDSPMDTFVASSTDRHPTELAALVGARMVTASETDAGKRWDEPKLKRLTGGDPITARHMREDFFTYIPQFKLIFIGNHKPEIRNLDKAMRRRTHLVPFTVTPQAIDQELGSKLRQEWPAILAWMIEGCIEWQREGLNPPGVVKEATADYFDESDPIGQWFAECTQLTADPDVFTPLLDLYDSWKEWANRHGAYVGKVQRLSSVLAAHHLPKRKHPKKRNVEFGGIKIVNWQHPLEATAE